MTEASAFGLPQDQILGARVIAILPAGQTEAYDRPRYGMVAIPSSVLDLPAADINRSVREIAQPGQLWLVTPDTEDSMISGLVGLGIHVEILRDDLDRLVAEHLTSVLEDIEQTHHELRRQNMVLRRELHRSLSAMDVIHPILGLVPVAAADSTDEEPVVPRPLRPDEPDALMARTDGRAHDASLSHLNASVSLSLLESDHVAELKSIEANYESQLRSLAEMWSAAFRDMRESSEQEIRELQATSDRLRVDLQTLHETRLIRWSRYPRRLYTRARRWSRHSNA